MNWMAWTLPTASFFIAIASILTIMTVWEIKHPSVERKGFLPFTTTRGDRLFIGLLTSAFWHLFVIGATDWSLWLALSIAIVWLLAVMRWG